MQSTEVDKDSTQESVSVICQTKYYVQGWSEGQNLRLISEEDPKEKKQVDGIVLVVVSPPEYTGKVVTIHHDGYLASGDPYNMFHIGTKYEIKISKNYIGQFDFRLCSVDVRPKRLKDQCP